MMTTDIPDFKENVILIDASFLSKTLPGIKQPMEQHLGRTLPAMDLAGWLASLCSDAGLDGAEREVQVLMVCGQEDRHFGSCVPQDAETLDAHATATPCGEMSFAVIPTEGMVSTYELFLDMVSILANARGVEQLMLVPNRMDAAQDVSTIIDKVYADMADGHTLPQVTLFGFGNAAGLHGSIKGINVFLSVGHALGIRPDEIG